MSSTDVIATSGRMRRVTIAIRNMRWRRWTSLALAPVVAGTMANANGGDYDGSAWDRARAQLITQNQAPISQAIERWKLVSTTPGYGFSNYAGFVASYPGFPDEDRIRRAAEAALDRESPAPQSLVAFFDRFPPLTNPARAQYALALRTMGRPEAAETARAAWRGGPMSDAAETAILTTWGSTFVTADHDARIDALLWAGATVPAQRILPWTSPAMRALAQGRLTALAGGDPYAAAAIPAATLDADPGFAFARARELHRLGRTQAEAIYLASRPRLAGKPLDLPHWVSEQLFAAREAADTGDAANAARIALNAADSFAPGEDISQQTYSVRDDYTSLTWLGGTSALWHNHDPMTAASLFGRYASAARGPGVKAKGMYWAGLSLARSGHPAEARESFAAAAQHPDSFYGLLALERLGQPVPRLDTAYAPEPTPDERARFMSAPLTLAVRELARAGDWRTTIRFFKEIAEQQQTPGQHQLVAELAQSLGRRDLGVIVGQAAAQHGYNQFEAIAFPLIPVPSSQARSWTMIHAITRQESQFAQNAISHAGARGLMQMMPATANEQAGKLGLSFSADALITNPQFNMAVGGTFFDHLLTVFGGSYPLAVAAYNAGPGNVGKWLRANGDPRTGQIEWVDWIERIPLSETRGYVVHVMENAVVYEAMNPDKASYGGPNPLSHFLGKPTPG